MIEAIALIENIVDGEVREAFLGDKAKPHALAMFFVMMGEAANKVGTGVRMAHPEVPWQRIAKLRHIIAHEYRRIDHGELWEIAVNDIPRLAIDLPDPPPPEDFD